MESTLYVFLPDSVFLPCGHGLNFDNSLCEDSINQSKMGKPVEVGARFDCRVDYKYNEEPAKKVNMPPKSRPDACSSFFPSGEKLLGAAIS